MVDCSFMWNSFVTAMNQIKNGEVYDEAALITATGHVEDCPSCMAKWSSFMETIKPRPVIKRDLKDFLSPLVVKATGLPAGKISMDTPLGQLQIASLLIVLSAMDRNRRIPTFYPDEMTLGKLVTLWEAAEQKTPLQKRPALEKLDVTVK